MPKKNDSWGIEVGATAIKAIRLKRNGEQVSLAEYDVLPFKKMLTAPDVDENEAIRMGLDQFLTRHNLSKSTVVISVPGHRAFARFAKLPPVEPKKIPDIVRFEAVQQVPFPIEQVEWDYQTFQAPDSPDVEVGIFAIAKDRLIPWLSNFNQVNFPIHAISVTPVALFNAMSYDANLPESTGGTILVDIGTQATDMIITDGSRIWMRTIPMGGNHFTEALVRSFKLSLSKAEKLKREASTSKYARQIFQAMRPVFVDLVQEIQKSLGYYQSLNRDVELTRLIGLGNTWRLPGLQTFLKQQLQLDVQRLDSFKRIEVEGRTAATFAENVLSMAPAYGLALQGLDLQAINCNLLPTPLIRQVIWKEKQPTFIAAAAVIALAAGAAYLSTSSAISSISGNSSRELKYVHDTVDRAEKLAKEVTSLSSTESISPQVQKIEGLLPYRDVAAWVASDIDKAMLAMEPQAALLSQDPKLITQTLRGDRKLMYIDSITLTYSGDQTSSTTGPRMPMGPSNYNSMDTGSEVSEEDFWSQTPPYFTVTVKGTTPYADIPSDLLNDTFIQWLKDNADRADVPYVIVVGSNALQNISLVGVSSDRVGVQGRGNDAMIPRSGPSFQDFPRREEGMDYAPGRVPRTGIRGRVTPSTTSSTNLEVNVDVLPPDPLVDEDRSRDSEFTIVWKVQLRPPQELIKKDLPTTVNSTSTVAIAE